MAKLRLVFLLFLVVVLFSSSANAFEEDEEEDYDFDMESPEASPESSPEEMPFLLEPMSPSVFPSDSPTMSPTKSPTKKRRRRRRKKMSMAKRKPGAKRSGDETRLCPTNRRRFVCPDESFSCGFGGTTSCCGRTFFARFCTCGGGGERLRCRFRRPSCPCRRSSMRAKPANRKLPVINSCPATFLGPSARFSCGQTFRCNFGTKFDCCGARTYYSQRCTCFRRSRLRCFDSFVPESINRGRCPCLPVTPPQPTASNTTLPAATQPASNITLPATQANTTA